MNGRLLFSVFQTFNNYLKKTAPSSPIDNSILHKFVWFVYQTSILCRCKLHKMNTYSIIPLRISKQLANDWEFRNNGFAKILNILNDSA